MEIPLRRGRLDALTALFLLGYAAVATLLVAEAAALLDGAALVTVLVVVLVLWLFWSGLYVFNWTRMRRVDCPLALHGYGVFARSLFGELSVPWDAVQSATVERAWNGRLLRVRLVPTGDARFAGIGHSSLHPRVFAAVQQRGLRMSLAILDIGLDALRDAFVVQSGGRVQLL